MAQPLSEEEKQQQVRSPRRRNDAQGAHMCSAKCFSL
jgi:hypothetical protein